ncbi:unnamed protein product [Mytilus edulis]|uniref:Uncharacterized protein n=1 Tax=Mytilus edulis TaxID=6550 RepID=A0A8S3R8W0_MYTED|nr:unnamed protein product [Mytilus edulis]
MCIMKSFQDFLQKKNFRNSYASCDGEANLLINHNFTSCKGTQKTTESYPLSVTTEYSARTTESTTESQTATVSYLSSVTTTESTTGIINTEVIFLSSGGGILFLLSAAIACFCARKKYKRGNLTRNVNNHDDNVDRRAESSPNVSTNRGSDAQYEEIEEIEMSAVIVSPLEQRNLTDGDISSDSSADGIQVDEERRRNITNVYQSLQRSSLNESRLYSSLKSLHLEEIVDEPI